MDLDNARILVVEDDAVMRQYVVTMLDRLGVGEVQECSNGTQALDCMAGFSPDVVLTDVHMGPMDGFDFVRKIRTHASLGLRQSQVIFMSADSSTSTLKQALLLGTRGYIVKPPRLENLRTKLKLALNPLPSSAPPLAP